MSKLQTPTGISAQDWEATPPSVRALVDSLEQEVAPMPQWVPIVFLVGQNPYLRMILLTLYYLAIILALIALYGRGDFSTPPFVYQGF